jgi:hypothetical protein
MLIFAVSLPINGHSRRIGRYLLLSRHIGLSPRRYETSPHTTNWVTLKK